MGNKFIAGFNFGLLKERYTLMEFNYDPEPEAEASKGTPELDGNTKVKLKKIPYLSAINFKWQETYSECLQVFGSMY